MKRFVIASLVALGLSGAALADMPEQEQIEAARAAYIAGDHAAALAVLLPAAEAGDANAQNIVGAAYSDGHGVPVDPVAAQAWYEKSAAQGWVKAKVNLADLLREAPEGIGQDFARAITLYDEAKAEGYAYAFYARGRMHRLGQGGAADPVAARAEFEAGLKRGNGPAGNALADMHRLGEGGPKDEAAARAIYREAATLGYAISIGNLAFMYETGLGGPVDPVAAYALYVAAAERGDGNAAVNLADFIIATPGYWQDRPTALAWCLYGLDRARADQEEAFEGMCEAVAHELSEAEKAEAARIYAEW
ncbi:tetratricopeptide repeat protein [Rhodalgimonas zhirmunskyi]|uniref:Sel1 repeat family protein n=1 Tax=Rhodalgimonas zhirmunskyi TaxID=2964767 RepID=A0AAJ1UBG6_9RHOB|nr:tetratricopeptide repeat protein [Rhodoalgimonas zhirmunskyi]MDQ2092832.1 sel1 repeat family protein [Rhodoalgimonas zhirmunskyi]